MWRILSSVEVGFDGRRARARFTASESVLLTGSDRQGILGDGQRPSGKILATGSGFTTSGTRHTEELGTPPRVPEETHEQRKKRARAHGRSTTKGGQHGHDTEPKFLAGISPNTWRAEAEHGDHGGLLSRAMRTAGGVRGAAGGAGRRGDARVGAGRGRRPELEEAGRGKGRRGRGARALSGRSRMEPAVGAASAGRRRRGAARGARRGGAGVREEGARNGARSTGRRCRRVVFSRAGKEERGARRERESGAGEELSCAGGSMRVGGVRWRRKMRRVR